MVIVGHIAVIPIGWFCFLGGRLCDCVVVISFVSAVWYLNGSVVAWEVTALRWPSWEFCL